jgi:hypothetical protein
MTGDGRARFRPRLRTLYSSSPEARTLPVFGHSRVYVLEISRAISSSCARAALF